MQNDEIRDELQGIVGGLTAYLASVQERAAAESSDCDQLTRDCEELRQHVRHLEDERELADAQADELEEMKRVCPLLPPIRVQKDWLMQLGLNSFSDTNRIATNTIGEKLMQTPVS